MKTARIIRPDDAHPTVSRGIHPYLSISRYIPLYHASDMMKRGGIGAVASTVYRLHTSPTAARVRVLCVRFMHTLLILLATTSTTHAPSPSTTIQEWWDKNAIFVRPDRNGVPTPHVTCTCYNNNNNMYMHIHVTCMLNMYVDSTCMLNMYVDM